MSTAGSIDIPDGDLVFDQLNVRIQKEGPHRSTISTGILQLKRTPIGYVVSWRPQTDSIDEAGEVGNVSAIRTDTGIPPCLIGEDVNAIEGLADACNTIIEPFASSNGDESHTIKDNSYNKIICTDSHIGQESSATHNAGTKSLFTESGSTFSRHRVPVSNGHNSAGFGSPQSLLSPSPLRFQQNARSKHDEYNHHHRHYQNGQQHNGWLEKSTPIDMAQSFDAVRIECRPNSFWFELREMKSYYLNAQRDRYELTVMLCDGTRLPTMLFDIGKQQAFLSLIESKLRTRVSSHDRRLHVVVHDNVDALQKSFNSLDLFQLDGGTDGQTFVGRFMREPLPTFATGLAKVTNFFTQQQHQFRPGAADEKCLTGGLRQISDGMLELNPASYEEFENTFTINVDQEPGFDFIEQIPELPSPICVQRQGPMGPDEWASYFDAQGRIADPNNLRERIFRGGCSPDVRPEAWKFLLGVDDFGKIAKERAVDQARRNESYYRMKLQWTSLSAEQESRFTAFAARKSLVEKDVNRTDRSIDIFARDGSKYLTMLNNVLMTYIMYDFDLGYVQGMSDLLPPIISVMQNEADSFWCFAKFVSRIRCNFVDHDRMEERDQRQLGIKLQLQQLHQILSVALPSFTEYLDNHESGNLYFCFRWLLIWFKREFSFEDIKRLWEVLWTGLPCENFHLLFCVAILKEERVRIKENMFGLTEILKHINDMSYKIPLEDNLVRAEQLYFQLLGVPKVAKILGVIDVAEEAV